MHEKLFRRVISRQALQSLGPKDCCVVLFYLKDRNRRVRTNDRIDPGIQNLCQVLRFFCWPFLMHNQDGANQKQSQRSRARPQQARNGPPTGGWTSAIAFLTFPVTFPNDLLTQLMTEKFFVLQ